MGMSRPVLCVSHDLSVRMALRQALAAAGFESTEARDGQEAIHAVALHRPAVVIVRSSIDDTGTLAWLSELRAKSTGGNPKVLLLGEGVADVDAVLPPSPDASTLGAVVRVLTGLAHGDISSPLSAGETRERLLANLSHELRNPLAAIRNADTLLRLASADPRVERAREVIDRQVTQLTRLVDDLLEVSQLARGRIELRSALLPVGLIVEQAVDQTRTLFEGRGQTLDVTLPEPVRVEGDLLRLAQALAHVLKNASRFTPDGGRVEVRTGAREGQATIAVRDNGEGIDPAQLPGLFAMFAQGPHESERAPGGLGLGLTLARALVELHGGRLEASSDGRGRGSEFVMTLPLAGPIVAPARDGEVALEPDETPYKVLVVDDNLDGAATLALLLEYAGFEVRTAHDGHAALRAVAQFSPDAVVLDIGLPGIDGHEVAKRLRADPTSRNLVLIALTGFAEGCDADKSAGAGFDHHFVKPTDSRVLSDLLADYAAKRTVLAR